MNSDLIKWLVSYAEGFEWLSMLTVYAPDGEPCRIDSESFKLAYYPLLLQKAIEGINKGEGFLIFQNFAEIRIEHNENDGFEEYFSFSDYEFEDQAKDQALKYIYEQG